MRLNSNPISKRDDIWMVTDKISQKMKKLGNRKLGTYLLILFTILAIPYLTILHYSWIFNGNDENIRIDEHVGTAPIPPGESFEFIIHVNATDREISYKFNVLSGPNVDVYLFTPSDYERYKMGLPAQDGESWDFPYIQHLTGSPYPEEGAYWVVIDNSDYGPAKPDGDEAVVYYHVSTSIPSEGSKAFEIVLQLFVHAIIIIILVALFALGIAYFMRSKLEKQDTQRPPT